MDDKRKEQDICSKKRGLLKRIGAFLLISFTGLVSIMFSLTTYAESGGISVPGRIYEFDGENAYEFSTMEDFSSSAEGKSYGSFSIAGNILDTSEKEGIPMYGVENGTLTFSYTYGNSLLMTEEEEWHLIEDKSRSVDDIKLDSDIRKGTLILQTSRDGKHWIDAQIRTNLFEDTPIQTEPFYSTTEIEMTSGTYYRVIVVYKTGIKTDSSKFLFLFNKDHYEYKRHAEVYEFFAYNKSVERDSENTKKYYFNSEDLLVNTGKDTGYSGHNSITEKDLHYGWSIGDFFVSGFTADRKDEEGNPVFLKNVGDQITLWFRLEQDINQLNGNSHLSIAEDENGYDQFFGIAKTNFSHGALIVRYTDYENNKQEPQIYTNYFEANVSPNADTQVQLFEEGDYEIALDYEIKNDPRKVLGQSVLPEYSNYRIYFKFSVRNGNCMVYPFDVTTKSELTNSSITENGFFLDLARSRYLDLTIKKEVLSSGADGLVEDTRFNKVTKDGDQYTDEGIYTISVSNRYTGQQTTKILYVGRDKLLKASVVNGIPLEEVNNQVELGAQIEEDGTILPPASEPETISEITKTGTPENTEILEISDSPNGDKAAEAISIPAEETEEMQKRTAEAPSEKKSNTAKIVGIAAAVVGILLVILFILLWKKRKDKKGGEEGNEQ